MRILRVVGAVLALALAAYWLVLTIAAPFADDVPNPWIGAYIAVVASGLVGVAAVLRPAAASFGWRPSTGPRVALLVVTAVIAAFVWLVAAVILGSS